MQTNEKFSLGRLCFEYKEVNVMNSRNRTPSEALTSVDPDINVGENWFILTD